MNSLYSGLGHSVADGGGGAMKNLIDYMVRAIVDHPEQVTVTEIQAEHTSVLELRVAKSDMGRVIGKRGRTAQAIRTIIISGASGKAGKRCLLEIVE